MKFQKFLNGFLTLLVLFLAGVLTFVTIRAVQGKPVMFRGYCVMQVITGSMEPALHVGDCVLVQQVSADSLQESDIIAYVSEAQDIFGLSVMHRITEILPDGSFLVMGDANPVPDPLPVRPDQIQGKFVKKLPLFTWLTSFTDLRKILLLVVMLVTCATAFYEARTVTSLSKELFEESEQERKERLIREAIDREKLKLAQNQTKEDDLP